MLLGVFVGHMAEGVLDALCVGEGVLFLGCYRSSLCLRHFRSNIVSNIYWSFII